MTDWTEGYDWNPLPGDRIEVIIGTLRHDNGSDAGRVSHARGVLVASYQDNQFVHCDARYPDGREWTGTFRPDQVCRERTMIDHLDVLMNRLSNDHDAPHRRSFMDWLLVREPSHSALTAQKELDLSTAFTIVDHLKQQQRRINIIDQILSTTGDGLKTGDSVMIREKRDGTITEHPGRFVAEYKGKRHVIFSNGGPAAFDSMDVKPL